MTPIRDLVLFVIECLKFKSKVKGEPTCEILSLSDFFSKSGHNL